MTTPQTLNDLIDWLKLIKEESKIYYPDNDSRNAGYRDAIQDVLDHLLGPNG